MAEAAGLALAILPLLVSALENYEACLQPIKTFIRFTSQAQDFQRHLKVQGAIFQNQCRILLAQAVDHDVAGHMLANKQHPAWNEQKIEDAIVQQLEHSKNASVTAISNVLSVLQFLAKWSTTLAHAIEVHIVPESNDLVATTTITFYALESIAPSFLNHFKTSSAFNKNLTVICFNFEFIYYAQIL